MAPSTQPTWEFHKGEGHTGFIAEICERRSQYWFAASYAYLNSGGGADAARFKALDLDELKLLRQRSRAGI